MPFKTLVNLYFDNKITLFPPGALTFFGYLNELEQLLNTPGLINLDEADLVTVLSGASKATIIKIDSPLKKITKELTCWLRQVKAKNADSTIFHVIGDEDMALSDINDIAEIIYHTLKSDAEIIFGATVDEGMKGAVRVLIALVEK